MLITQFYKDQDVFITGGSGFIGKALIEKLLRSCPEVGKVFVLLRNKKGKTAEQRLQEILKNPLFNLLKAEKPQILQNICAIAGDCAELGLGISAEDRQRIENVSIIFHSAASVRFDDPLKRAVLLNTRGTHELVKIAETLRYLKVFIHISTTYCNPDKYYVEEKIYPPYADWRKTIKIAEALDIDTLNILNLKYGDNQPNTYTFTKSLSEHVINDYRDKIPVSIFRPSIVISSLEEPVPGWIDNFNGPVGMLIACGLGIMRTSYADPDIISDFMPVDIVARALLVAAYKKGLNIQKDNTAPIDQLEIINSASANISCIKAAEVVELGKKMVLKNPLEKTLWVPGGDITRCRVWNCIRIWTLHIFMAVLVDTGLRLSNQKPMLLKLQRRIYEANNALHYFMTNSWVFINTNFRALHDIVPKSEFDKFGFWQYTESFDNEIFFENALRGAREFLLKEPKESSKGARRRLEIFKALDYFIKLIGKLLIIRFFVRFLYFCFFK